MNEKKMLELQHSPDRKQTWHSRVYWKCHKNSARKLVNLWHKR